MPTAPEVTSDGVTRAERFEGVDEAYNYKEFMIVFWEDAPSESQRDELESRLPERLEESDHTLEDFQDTFDEEIESNGREFTTYFLVPSYVYEA